MACSRLQWVVFQAGFHYELCLNSDSANWNSEYSAEFFGLGAFVVAGGFAAGGGFAAAAAAAFVVVVVVVVVVVDVAVG